MENVPVIARNVTIRNVFTWRDFYWPNKRRSLPSTDKTWNERMLLPRSSLKKEEIGLPWWRSG